jgi:hypothetical protein
VSALAQAAGRLDAAVLEAPGWRRALLPPVVAFAAALVLLSAVAVYGGESPLSAGTWTSWDSPIYVDIAEHGYQVTDCSPAEIQQGAKACGNIGWFPLYPGLMVPLIAAGFSANAAGVLVSTACWLALLIVLWNGLLLPAGGRSRLPALALAAVAPGAYYFHTLYPMAVTALLLTVALVCLRRERWLGAGLAGFLATTAYPAAALLAPVAGLWLLAIAPAPAWRERARRIALVCVPTVAGFVAVLAYAQIATGQWDGYFGVQARFHHGIHLPFANYVDLATPRLEGLGHVSVFLAFQAWLTTALVAAVLYATWRRRGAVRPFDWLIVLWALAFWIVPLMQNVVAYYRTDALLVPVVVALTGLSRALVGTFAVAAAVVAAGMTLAFMQGVLV